MDFVSGPLKKISVCLCTYNGAQFLSKQLESIIHQTLVPDEIVVVDDCSVDQTPEILLHYQRIFPSLFRVFFNSSNLGYKGNFARVLSLSQGSLIFFADQDDVWDKTKISKMVSVFDSMAEVSSVSCCLELIDEFGKKIGPSTYNKSLLKINKQKEQWKLFLRHPLVPGTALAVRRAFIAQNWPIPSGFLHDEWFSLCSSFENGLFVIPETLVFYRQHSGQAIGDHYKSFFQKKSFKVDFSALNNQYSFLLSSESISARIKKRFLQRSQFFSFREKLRSNHCLVSLLLLFCHPRFFIAYFRFCDTPLFSMGKDLLVFEDKGY